MSNNILAFLGKLLGEQGLTISGILGVAVELVSYFNDVNSITHLIAVLCFLFVLAFGIYNQSKTNQYKAETERIIAVNSHKEGMKELEQKDTDNDDPDTE